MESSADLSFATFDRALEDYLASLPQNKKHTKFVELCRDSGTSVTPNAINDLLLREEARRTLSGPTKKIFTRVMNALADYGEVIGQLASAQPLPCAIIWGALKVVVESSDRCDNMFESMKEELLALAEYLQRITVYEDLYGDSKEMQRLFFRSYTNIIRFWHRVHKECKRKAISTIGRSMTSSTLKKMKTIISEIRSVSNSITEQASLCQGQKDKQEYMEARSERKLQNDWREKQSTTNYLELCTQIRDHLAPKSVEEPNSRLHEWNLRQIQAETCQWLLEDSCCATWWGTGPNPRRLFCLSGPPGYGKSTLTSFAIRHLELKGAAVAHYFCHFAQPCDDPNEVLRLLALQLFNIYFSRRLPLDHDLGHHILSSRSPKDVQQLIRNLVINLLPNSGVYFLVDGLDEAAPACISDVLHFLNDLRKEFLTEQVGLWVTKQRHSRVDSFDKHIQPDLTPGLTLELKDHTEADVVRFLQAKLCALKERFSSEMGGSLNETDQMLFLSAEKYLIARAEGHFLWAEVMTKDFDGANRVEDVKELLNRIVGDQPERLADLYKRFITRFLRLSRDDQRIAIKVMSLVAYARRPLRLEELQDAAVFLVSPGKKKAASSDANHPIGVMPLKTFLARYTTLVEIHGNSHEPSPSDTCRLVHSSFFEYLDQNPAILDKDAEDSSLHISRLAIANACLAYLCRPVSARLFRKQTLPDGIHTWVDHNGTSIDKYHLCQYAAKYWVKHLEDLEKNEQERITARVVSFVRSNRFQTCMQIQSIWVQGRFDIYYVGGQRSLLRAIPDWLIRDRPTGRRRATITKHWLDYWQLMHDWRTLLSCGGCHDSDPECGYLTFRGEPDRIWWTALGPEHSFSGFQGRYMSFRLADGNMSSSERFEAVSVSKQQIVLVRLEDWNHAHGSLQFVCEHWWLAGPASAPSLRKKQVIHATEADTNWGLYAKPPSAGLARLVARPTALSSNAQLLRIGAQLFRRDMDNEYSPIPSGACPAYFEEASGRGTLVAVGSRAHTLAAQLQEPYRIFDSLGEDFSRLERANFGDNKEADSDTTSEASDIEWLSDSVADSADEETEAYEFWSEGSTDDDGGIASEDTNSDSDLSESSGADSESEDFSSTSSSGESASPEPASDRDGGTPSVLSLSAFPGPDGSQDSDREEDLWGMEVDARLGAMHHGRPVSRGYPDVWASTPHEREPVVLLTVFEYVDHTPPMKLLEYSCPLRSMLYDSPPALHPQESLVVWPLGGGDLLFADVLAKTYFTRQLRPSAPHTRHISVKLRFSPCGHFLHVASLEVQVTPVKGDSLPELHLYMLVLTYRLSRNKPTRSPPVLLRRVKVDMGQHDGLSVSQLPFVYTWSARDLFVTQRATTLEVRRVQLFSESTRNDQSPNESVLVPVNTTVLPDSAAFRDVFFVPLSDDANGASMVVIGSETRIKAELVDDLVQLGLTDETFAPRNRRNLAPPIGAVLQTDDMGGWVPATGDSVPQGRFVGKLDMRKEKFDPVDDCYAELYPDFA